MERPSRVRTRELRIVLWTGYKYRTGFRQPIRRSAKESLRDGEEGRRELFGGCLEHGMKTAVEFLVMCYIAAAFRISSFVPLGRPRFSLIRMFAFDMSVSSRFRSTVIAGQRFYIRTRLHRIALLYYFSLLIIVIITHRIPVFKD